MRKRAFIHEFRIDVRAFPVLFEGIDA